MTVSYDGKRFRKAGAAPGEDVPNALYRQDGDLVWGEFAGGDVRRGSLTGLCGQDGRLEFAYTMVLDTGEVIAGRSVSTPEILPDGRILLHEDWERFTPKSDRGVSRIEEVR